MNQKAHQAESLILVVDLEATCCDQGSISSDEMEIIEIGACWTYVDGSVIDRFQCFVRPTLYPTLTPFCKSLLGINQNDLDGADVITSALDRLRKFAEAHRADATAWGSWGAFDHNQIQRECARCGIHPPINLPHENLKRRFAKSLRIGKEVGMRKALELARLEHKGAHHRALDDALNVARLMPWAMGLKTLPRDFSQAPLG